MSLPVQPLLEDSGLNPDLSLAPSHCFSSTTIVCVKALLKASPRITTVIAPLSGTSGLGERIISSHVHFKPYQVLTHLPLMEVRKKESLIYESQKES